MNLFLRASRYFACSFFNYKNFLRKPGRGKQFHNSKVIILHIPCMFERISSKNLKFMRSIFSLQYLFIFILLSGYYTVSTGQSESDSIKIQTLSPVTIQSWNEVISLDQMSANVTEKTARQIFAKVPGIFVYDMDGAGNQINIATRGLDPHRGWEFNIRKDGVITNSDMYA